MSRYSKKTQVACSVCFKSLGVPARHIIYGYLKSHGACTVSELVTLVNLTQPTVSYHLHDMKESGLLTSRKAGKEVHYSINSECPTHHNDCVLKNVDIVIS